MSDKCRHGEIGPTCYLCKVLRIEQLEVAAKALVDSASWLPESDLRVVGHDEFYDLAALIDTSNG